MTLIEKIFIDDIEFSFFEGADFDVIMNHPKDGSKGFLFCFIENWTKEIKSWKRESQINSLLFGNSSKKFNTQELENDFVSIYQLQGTDIDTLFNVIKEKVINRNFLDHHWITVSGIEKGAWKIGKSKVWN